MLGYIILGVIILGGILGLCFIDSMISHYKSLRDRVRWKRYIKELQRKNKDIHDIELPFRVRESVVEL